MEKEKRLIDVNRLKGALREVIIEEKQQNNDTTFLSQIGYLLDACPTVDAVEVVRCKDCIHRRCHSCYREVDRIEELMAKKGVIFAHNAPTYSITNWDDFCSCGERKDNESH